MWPNSVPARGNVASPRHVMTIPLTSPIPILNQRNACWPLSLTSSPSLAPPTSHARGMARYGLPKRLSALRIARELPQNNGLDRNSPRRESRVGLIRSVRPAHAKRYCYLASGSFECGCGCPPKNGLQLNDWSRQNTVRSHPPHGNDRCHGPSPSTLVASHAVGRRRKRPSTSR